MAAQTSPRAFHVIHISVDGLAAIHLQNFLATAPDSYPNFLRLTHEGAFTLNARCDYDYSETIPNHTTMWLGRPVSQPNGWPDTLHHGIVYNSWSYSEPVRTFHNTGNPNVSYFFSVFDVAHDHGLSTAFFAGKAKLAICPASYNESNGAPDLIAEDNGQNKVDYSDVLEWMSGYDCQDVMNSVTNYLADHAPNYLFLHLADLDYAGHFTGWGSPDWGRKLAEIDSCLGSLFEALARNPDFDGQTTIVLTADHGGGSPTYTHVDPYYPLNYTIPFMVWGPGWPIGTNLYDILANRFDPGTNRLDYTVPHQPIRNGDAPNLALAVLGLPPIPGSSLLPAVGPKLRLDIAATPAGLVVSWPSPAEGYVLECADGVGPAATWRLVTTGIEDNGVVQTYKVPSLPGAPPQYFRLTKALFR